MVLYLFTSPSSGQHSHSVFAWYQIIWPWYKDAGWSLVVSHGHISINSRVLPIGDMIMSPIGRTVCSRTIVFPQALFCAILMVSLLRPTELAIAPVTSQTRLANQMRCTILGPTAPPSFHFCVLIYSLEQWPSQVTDNTRALHAFFCVCFFSLVGGLWWGGGGLGACSPSKFFAS